MFNAGVVDATPRRDCRSLRTRAANLAFPCPGPGARGEAFLRAAGANSGSGLTPAEKMKASRSFGAVAKWLGNGLQNRHTSVRIRSAPPPWFDLIS